MTSREHWELNAPNSSTGLYVDDLKWVYSDLAYGLAAPFIGCCLLSLSAVTAPLVLMQSCKSPPEVKVFSGRHLSR
jgi:hypothetical protein